MAYGHRVPLASENKDHPSRIYRNIGNTIVAIKGMPGV